MCGFSPDCRYFFKIIHPSCLLLSAINSNILAAKKQAVCWLVLKDILIQIIDDAAR